MYKVCIDRVKIEENLKEIHKFGSIQNLKAPVMIIDEKDNLIEHCSEIEFLGESKIIYRPDEKLKTQGYQITLWVECEAYRKIK